MAMKTQVSLRATLYLGPCRHPESTGPGAEAPGLIKTSLLSYPVGLRLCLPLPGLQPDVVKAAGLGNDGRGDVRGPRWLLLAGTPGPCSSLPGSPAHLPFSIQGRVSQHPQLGIGRGRPYLGWLLPARLQPLRALVPDSRLFAGGRVMSGLSPDSATDQGAGRWTSQGLVLDELQASGQQTGTVHCDVHVDQGPRRSDQPLRAGEGAKEIFPEPWTAGFLKARAAPPPSPCLPRHHVIRGQLVFEVGGQHRAGDFHLEDEATFKPQLSGFWPVLQRPGPHAVSKASSNETRLWMGPCSPCPSLTLCSSVVLSGDSTGGGKDMDFGVRQTQI
ncbi:hypothetical protein Cadr_000019310 [Camelus dromedarius]|uniref:Uncharacterized protein n=1 Tax=Camelus dromedarius TaxID=9838 RepID=A0A5N4D1U6_CAMDR|nr:hypothetical protein Cadr_000019310 [Camelus dromedarius]